MKIEVPHKDKKVYAMIFFENFMKGKKKSLYIRILKALGTSIEPR